MEVKNPLPVYGAAATLDFLDALENSGSPDCQERERLLADNGKLEDARLLADCRQAFIRRSPMVRPDAGRACRSYVRIENEYR